VGNGLPLSAKGAEGRVYDVETVEVVAKGDVAGSELHQDAARSPREFREHADGLG